MMWFCISRLYLPVVTGLIVFITGSCCGLEQLVYTFKNQVGGGNFTYFKLHRDGVVRLELKTVSGDADLYVSSVTLSPDYINYELSSATCGEDEIIIPAEIKRPVGVGVFGHPFHEVSQFVLSVYCVYDNASDELGSLVQPDSRSSRSAQTDTDQHESLLWSIFVGLLKIILDIMV